MRYSCNCCGERFEETIKASTSFYTINNKWNTGWGNEWDTEWSIQIPTCPFCGSENIYEISDYNIEDIEEEGNYWEG